MSGLVQHTLKPGIRFALKNQACEVSFADANVVRYAPCHGGRAYMMPTNTLWELVDAGKIGFLSQSNDEAEHDPLRLRLTNLDEAARLEMMRRFKYIQQILKAKSRSLSKSNLLHAINVIAERLEDASPPSKSTLARWVKRYVVAGADALALAPLHQYKGCRDKKLTLEVETTIRRSLLDDYLADSRPSVEQVYANVVGRINEDATVPPEERSYVSKRTMYRRAKDLDPYIVCLKREGKRVADARFRAAGASIQASRLMEMVMMDGHKMDLLVVDGETGEVLGRPYLVCLFDVATRAVVGWYISLLPFCATTALAAIKDMCSRDPMKGPGGVAERILPDNGTDLASQALRNLCMRLGMHIDPAKSYCPDDKANIERFFRTVNTQLVHTLAGTTFSSLEERGDYDSVAKATVTLARLRQLFNQWLTTVYHRAKHSTTRRVPEKLWRDQQATMPILSFPAEDIDVIARVVCKRMISNGSVIVDYLRYKSDALRTLEIRGQRNVVVLTDELDLSHVFVYLESDPKTLYRADGVDMRYMAGLTKYEHDKCQAALNAMAAKDREELGIHAYEIARWNLWKEIHDLPKSVSAKKLALLTQGKGRRSTAESTMENLKSHREIDYLSNGASPELPPVPGKQPSSTPGEIQVPTVNSDTVESLDPTPGTDRAIPTKEDDDDEYTTFEI